MLIVGNIDLLHLHLARCRSTQTGIGCHHAIRKGFVGSILEKELIELVGLQVLQRERARWTWRKRLHLSTVFINGDLHHCTIVARRPCQRVVVIVLATKSTRYL